MLVLQYSKGGGNEDASLFDSTYYGVYFYPFSATVMEHPIFAVVGGDQVIVARASTERYEVIRKFKDDGFGGKGLYCACWTRDQKTGDPLLVVGGKSAIIKVLNVKTGTCVRLLTGHNDEVNDIVRHPTKETVIATTGSDYRIIIWSLHPMHEKQPISIIISGIHGHVQNILTLDFHATGRYLLSGGMDNRINLWVIPEDPAEGAGKEKPTQIVRPHFSTNRLHSNYVDCVKWYHDTILSRAATESKIIHWKIDGFNSSSPFPTLLSAPARTSTILRETINYFGPPSYRRLHQFSAPNTIPWYLRFGFLYAPGLHPMIAIGSTDGRILFWNLEMLYRFGKCKGKWVGHGENKYPQLEGPRESDDQESSEQTRPKKKYLKRDNLGNVFRLVHPHQTLRVRGTSATPFRNVAWSPDGKWCVAVGEGLQIVVMSR
ncbi:WD40-repeat-containing domain protein [Pyronema omphalodes]|nr:WD40-repeat-containing domain protein [Pyronema omphalodes]